MPDKFDPTPYARMPRLNTPSGVWLSISLLSAFPKKPPALPERVTNAGHKLRTATIALQRAWKDSTRTARSETRLADNAIDRAWGALHGRLDDYASLPEDDFPNAARAAELLRLVFTDGLAFLKLKYRDEWAESGKRLTKIDDDGLQADIDKLAGPEFLANVKSAHERYGKVLAITEPAGDAEPGLVEPLQAVIDSIRSLLTQLVSVADEKPELIPAVHGVLKPIDDFRDREQEARRAAASGKEPLPPPEATPDTPVPEVSAR